MSTVTIRIAQLSDLAQLDEIEKHAFQTDRLSKRRLKHWITADNGLLHVAEQDEQLLGYALVLLHKGSVLARLYSLAVAQAARGKGIAKKLIQACELDASKQGRLYMRLEVAQHNLTAITLYQQLAYRTFAVYPDYYEDHQDALRMQKRLYYKPQNLTTPKVPWYQQTTEFTCGPAACMMAMAALSTKLKFSQTLELDLWREATTIFMTSGHGGCHPIGLALAVQKRGFNCEVYVNQTGTLFLDGVRKENKRQIIATVDNQFRLQALERQLPIHTAPFNYEQIQHWLNAGKMLVILISSYRIDGKKAPHWVTVSGIDDHCLYVHDPDPAADEHNQLACEYLPITRENFAKMSLFGKGKLRSLIVIDNQAGQDNQAEKLD